ncbi:TetR/AcrR family transcriptional regulator C-terminal domain-containing protein [Oceaniserpentilla sp. 4NH20-0058]|uniref:TetR/AcrR family transcriptional regulator C-terminal domain-containing protein n=1 Tax=Oceaniserpentilla sp. 4NH20-0058 TaxID=3127660 RepID=UPI003107292A
MSIDQILTMPDDVKPPLSREKILAVAMNMADEQGLQGLSMRKLADELGVKAMSLYNHVKNKDDLIDGLVEKVVAEIPIPDISKPWKAELANRGMKAHQVLMRHPWASVPLVSRANVGPNMMSYVNATLGCLIEAGFSPALADHAWNAMDNYIYGFTLQSLNFPFKEGEYQQVAQQYLPSLPKAQWPYLYALSEKVAMGEHDGVNHFEFGFEFILDGLEGLLNRTLNSE